MRPESPPQRGDKLYSIWNGVLSTVTFLEESVSFGAHAPSWLVKEPNGSYVRCSVGSYFTSELLATQDELRQHEESLECQLEELKKARREIGRTKETIMKLKDAVARLS